MQKIFFGRSNAPNQMDKMMTVCLATGFARNTVNLSQILSVVTIKDSADLVLCSIRSSYTQSFRNWRCLNKINI